MAGAITAEFSAKRLRAMRRVGRRPLGATARYLIAIRIDPQVLAAEPSFALKTPVDASA